MFKLKFKMDTSGVEKMLKGIESNAKRLTEPHMVPLADLLTPAFMRAHSAYATMGEFFAAAGVAETAFVEMGDEEKDAITSKHTNFGSWEALLGDAKARYIEREILK